MLLGFAICAQIAASWSQAVDPPLESLPGALPVKLFDKPHLANVFCIHPQVISGGLPVGGPGFAKLKELGVRTIISVDGAKTQAKLAKQYGMRYVHLPHGYDGVPAERVKQLAKAVRSLEGPIYIHCHHGKHRSPAAAAVACISAGLIGPESAVPILEVAGTSQKYRGLYESATAARPLDPKLLDDLDVEFQAAKALPPLAEAMVEIDERFEALEQRATNRWRPLANHPDRTASYEALMLREHLTELMRKQRAQSPRDEAPAEYDDRFIALLSAGLERAQELEISLRELEASPPRAAMDEVQSRFHAVNKNCIACHVVFRDRPLSAKSAW